MLKLHTKGRREGNRVEVRKQGFIQHITTAHATKVDQVNNIYYVITKIIFLFSSKWEHKEAFYIVLSPPFYPPSLLSI